MICNDNQEEIDLCKDEMDTIIERSVTTSSGKKIIIGLDMMSSKELYK